MTSSVVRRRGAVALFFLCLLAFASAAEATHFFGGTLSWKRDVSAPPHPLGYARIIVTFTAHWRASYPWSPAPTPGTIGQTVHGYSIIATGPGWSSAHSLPQIIEAVYPEDDTWTGKATVTIEAPLSAFPLTLDFASGDRNSNLLDGNRDKPFRLTTVVDLSKASGSAQAGSLPVIYLSQGQQAQFQMPSIVPDGNTARWSFAPLGESGLVVNRPMGIAACSTVNPAQPCVMCNSPNGFDSPQACAGGMLLSQSGGIHWTPQVAGVYQTQFKIESVDMLQQIKASTPLDVTFEVIPPCASASCAPPEIEIAQPTYTAIVGQPMSVGIDVTHPNPMALITRVSSHLPVGSTLAFNAGPGPNRLTFDWTPAIADSGNSHLVCLQATDNANNTSTGLSCFAVFVQPPPPPALECLVPTMTAATYPTIRGTILASVNVTSSGNLPMGLQWTLNGASVPGGGPLTITDGVSTLSMSALAAQAPHVVTATVRDGLNTVTCSVNAVIPGVPTFVDFPPIVTAPPAAPNFNLAAARARVVSHPGVAVPYSFNSPNISVVSGDAVTFGGAVTQIVVGSGSATIRLTFPGVDGYAPSYAERTVQVPKQPLQISLPPITAMTYGNSLPAFYFLTTASGVYGQYLKDNEIVVTYNGSTAVPKNVGTYNVTVAFPGNDSYSANSVSGTYVVNPAVLTLKAVNNTRTYGDSQYHSPLAYSLTGFHYDDASRIAEIVQGTVSYVSSAAINSPVGTTYTLTPTGLSLVQPPSGSPNYTLVTQTGQLSIERRAMTIRVNNATRGYGSANPAFTLTYNSLVAGDTATSLSGTPVFTTAATPSSAIGTYNVTVTGLSSPNYTITYPAPDASFGKLTIARAPLTIAVNNASKNYGASLPAFTLSYSGLVLNQTASVVTGSAAFATSATAQSNVGEYPVSVSGLTTANYQVSFVAGTLTVVPVPVTVTVQPSTRLYGAGDPAFASAFTGLVNNDTPAALGTLAYATTAVENSGVGQYAVTAAGLTSPNYTYSYGGGSMMITPAPLTVMANNASRVYGDADPMFSASYAGLVAGDTAAMLSAPQFAPAANAASSVGSYALNVSGVASPNYDVTFVAGTLSITRATVVVRPQPASRVYGAGNPSFSVGMTGFFGEDGPEDVSGQPAFATTAISTSGVGEYPVTVDVSGMSAANYVLAAAPGTLTVTPAALTIGVAPASRSYGAANPEFAPAFSGFVAGDTAAAVGGTPLYSTSAGNTSPVGSYAVTPSGFTAANYAISYANGTLEVTKTPLVIRANDVTRHVETANPVFTAGFTGFVNGETVAALSGMLSFSTTAVISSAAGAYPITVGGVSSSNYDISFVTGTLTVEEITTPGEMNGDGFVRDDEAKYSFSFRSKENDDRERARISIRVDEDGRKKKGKKRDDRFESRTVAAIAFSDDPTIRPGRTPRPQIDTVAFSGYGEWNGAPGYRYEASAQDAGEPGRHRESIRVTIWSPAGAVVATFEGELDGGNIRSKRIKH